MNRTRCRRIRVTALASCALLTCLLIFDSGPKVRDALGNATGGYASRGQSYEQWSALFGREEMWGAVWDFNLESPF